MRTTLVAPALLALCLLASSASALEWLPGGRDRVFSGTPAEAAQAYLHEQPTLASVELEPRAELRAPVGTTVRLRQRWQGLPVLGGEAAVRVTLEGRVTTATASLWPRLALASTHPALTAADAVALVASRGQVATSAVRTPRLAVLPDEETPGGGWLVWELDAASGGHGGERWVVDARNGDVRRRQSLGREVKGRVYATSFLATPTPTDVDLLDLDPVTPGWLTGFSGQLSVYQYVSGGYSSVSPTGGYTAQPSAGPNSGEDYLYDPPDDKLDKTDMFSSVNTYYHTRRVRKFYTDVLGIDMSDPSWKLGVVANALDDGKFLNNAFYSPLGLSDPSLPNMVAIGQGHVDFAYDSDVFIHEFTHYVSHNAIDYNDGQFGLDKYGTSPFGGSIDEGIADFYACTINGDPILGEAALGQYARDLSQTDKVCPDGLTGEIHEDGKIIGSSSWAIRGLLGEKLADQLVWGGFSLLLKGTSLQDFATGVLATADDMVAAGQLTADQRSQIAQEFTKRSLDDCGHVLSLNTSARSVNMYGLDTVGQYFGASCDQVAKYGSMTASFQFSYRPEPGARRVRFDVSLAPQQGFGGSDELSWGIYLTTNRTVPFSTSGEFPKVGKVDAKVTDLADVSGELTIGEGTDITLDPEATYTIAVVHKNCPYTQAYVEAFSDLEIPPPQGGAGGHAGSASQAGSGGHAGKSSLAGKSGSGGSTHSGAAGTNPAGTPSLEPVAGGEVGGGCQASTAPPSSAGLGALLALGAVACRRRRPVT